MNFTDIMPYKRSYAKKRGSRPSYRSCGKMVLSDASKALAIAKGVRRLINVEYKFLDTVTAVSLSTTPLIIQLSNIVQGDTTITRDGSQLKVLSIQLSYLLAGLAADAISHIRVMLIKDRQTNQAIYVPADVLEDISSSDAITSPYNRDNRQRFTILHDKVWVVVAGAMNMGHSFGQKFAQEQILRYDANAGTIVDLTQCSYSLLVVTSATSNQPAFRSFVRLNFVDN